MRVPGFHGIDEFRHLDTVGADVLDRRGADGAGNEDEVFQAGVALAQGPAHEVVPALSRGHADQHAIVALEGLDAARRHRQDGAVEITLDEQVAAFAEHEDLARLHGRVRQQLGDFRRVAHLGKQFCACIHA